jgi:putative ABC transport system ATP-binding protein
MSQFELSGVGKSFARGSTIINAVLDVELTIEQAELVAIEGPSGSGKTTLLQLLGALDRPSNGRISFEGRDLAQLGDGDLAELRLRSFGFVFQQFNLIPTLTALENVEAKLAPTGIPATELRERASALLDEVGLASRATHLPAHLSGGEQQRVAIARALSVEPHVILADEPTGNLDSATGGEILELIRRSVDDVGQTVVMVTHEARAAGIADLVLFLADGLIVREAKEATQHDIVTAMEELSKR